MSARIEPGGAATKDLDFELALFKVHAIDICNLQLAAGNIQSLDMATIGNGMAFLGSGLANDPVRYTAATLGAGVADDFGLGWAYANSRTLRIADGPDEVHRNHIAKLELSRYLKA